MDHQPTTYRQAGVDLELGDEASEILYNASRLTWKNRAGRIGEVDEEFPGFFSLRSTNFSSLPNGIIGGHNQDGVGTKIEVAERVDNHETIAYDLFAMVCDDAAVRGTEPVLFGSTLSVNKISTRCIRQLASGMVRAAEVAGVAVTNGELAELGDRVSGYGDFSYDWAATILWLAYRSRLCRYDLVTEGQSIVAFREHGFRSNGLSLVRKVFQTAYGGKWHSEPFDGISLGEAVLTPSVIYTPLVTALTGGVSYPPTVEGNVFAHITGGGIPGKLGRVLSATGCGAYLDKLFPPPSVMTQCQKDGRIDLEEAYRAWNMGSGMLCITNEPEKVMRLANDYQIEAQIAGEVVSRPGITVLPPEQFGSRRPILFKAS